ERPVYRYETFEKGCLFQTLACLYQKDVKRRQPGGQLSGQVYPQGGHQQQPDNIRKRRHGEIQVEGLQGQQDQNHGTSLSGIYPQVHAAYTPQRFLQDKVLWDNVIGEQQNRNGGLFQVTESNKVHLLLRRSVHL